MSLPEPGGDQFPATPWSALLQDGADGTPSSAAWEQLARAYWKPLYAFLRHRGADHHSASDDIQGFFAHLLQRDFLQRVDRGGGLFRSFLLRSLQNWRTDQHRAATTQKRGGDEQPLSFDDLESANDMPVDGTGSPEEAFDRSWAHAVFRNAVADLQKRLEARGRGPQFAKLRGIVTGEATDSYEAIGQELTMTTDAVKKAASKLRKEFGQVLRDEVRRTVASDGQVDDEIRYLIGLTQTA